jgi:cytidylate kinase/pantoate ligase/cytidylate kinase
MIVTIDGPAGAGKSSISRSLARELGFRFLDTGAMYRAVTWAAITRGISLLDGKQLGQLVRDLQLRMTDDQVLLDDHDVSLVIRAPEVTESVRFVADNLQVRSHLSVLQRRLADGVDMVTEGRDQGTVVFPQAECKIFLSASPEERARRRQAEMLERGIPVSYDEVLRQQTERDRHDVERPVGGLQKAADAVEVCTDGLTPHEVVAILVRVVRARQSETPGLLDNTSR